MIIWAHEQDSNIMHDDELENKAARGIAEAVNRAEKY